MAPENGHLKSEYPPKPFTLEQAKAFTKGAITQFRGEKLGGYSRGLSGQCIDGRYTKDTGLVAMAGGDAGLLAVALAYAEQLRRDGHANLSDKAVLKHVLEAIGGEEHFHYHSDTHAAGKEGVESLNGCGHFKHATTDVEVYGLTKGLADFMREYLGSLKEKGTTPAILEDDHKERAVFIVHSVTDLKKRTLATPKDFDSPGAKLWTFDHQVTLPGEPEPSQAFVYRADYIGLRLLDLETEFKQDLGGTRTNEEIRDGLHAAEQKQFNETARRLASGKPIYNVFIDIYTGEHEVAEA